MPGLRFIPATFPGLALLLLLSGLLIATPAVSAAARAGPGAPPAAPQEDATPTDPASDEERLQEVDDTWVVTRAPAEHYWKIASYLKGTPAEVRTILDKQVLEFDDKLFGVLADIKQNERETQAQTDEALSILRSIPAYKALQSQADAAKAEADAARASGAPIEQRMNASSKYNRLKTELDKLERQAIAKTSVPSLKAAREPLEARADSLYSKRGEALVWRQKLVTAILVGQTIRGDMVPGRTVGLIKGATVDRVMEDHSVLATFKLILNHKIVGEREGVKQIEGRAADVKLLIRGLDDVHRLLPKHELASYQTFKVTGIQEVDNQRVYLLEPYACDFNYLVSTIIKPPKMKAPPRGMIVSPTTKSVIQPPAKEPAN